MDAVEKKVEIPKEALEYVSNRWLLGADPEFAVVSPPNRTVANAGDNLVEDFSSAGGIGSDHGGRVWELRPTPSRSAYGLTTNLWRLLKGRPLAKVEQFKWKSGALGGLNTREQRAGQVMIRDVDQFGNLFDRPARDDELPFAERGGEDTLGGHVHFGLRGLNPQQHKALRQLTTALLNLDVLPMKENTKRISLARMRGLNYGSLTNDCVRESEDGTHCEFRAAPSWLDKPGQALAALTSYKLAAVRPGSVDWTDDYSLKENYLDWLDSFIDVDVDALLLTKLVDKQGFNSIQADPSADFKLRWRREDLWAK